MNFRRSPIFVHISDINKQINEHERLVLVCKDKTASFAFKTFDIGTLFYRKRVSGEALSEQQLSASFDEKDVIFAVFNGLFVANERIRFVKRTILLH